MTDYPLFPLDECKILVCSLQGLEAGRWELHNALYRFWGYVSLKHFQLPLAYSPFASSQQEHRAELLLELGKCLEAHATPPVDRGEEVIGHPHWGRLLYLLGQCSPYFMGKVFAC